MDQHRDPTWEELRTRMRATVRSHRLATEREAVRRQWSERALVDVAVEAMHRGDELLLRLPGERVIRGAVIDAGRDYAVLRSGRQRIAVRLAGLSDEGSVQRYGAPPVQMEVAARARSGGTRGLGRIPTFAAVIGSYDAEQQSKPLRTVEIGTSLSVAPVRGRIRARAWDHVYVSDTQQREVFVPLRSITYITWADPDA